MVRLLIDRIYHMVVFVFVLQLELLPEEVLANVELKPLHTMVDLLRLATPDLGNHILPLILFVLQRGQFTGICTFIHCLLLPCACHRPACGLRAVCGPRLGQVQHPRVQQGRRRPGVDRDGNDASSQLRHH